MPLHIPHSSLLSAMLSHAANSNCRFPQRSQFTLGFKAGSEVQNTKCHTPNEKDSLRMLCCGNANVGGGGGVAEVWGKFHSGEHHNLYSLQSTASA